MNRLIRILSIYSIFLFLFFVSIYSQGCIVIEEWEFEPASTRGDAMGRSNVALVDGSGTVFWNPGGAASLNGINSLYTNYHRVNSKDAIYAISFNARTKRQFNLGLNYYRNDNWLGDFNTIGIFFGYSFNNISIGINPKIFNLNNDGILTFEKNAIFEFDCGVLYSKDFNIKAFSFLKNLSFGASILNISESIKFRENIVFYRYTDALFPRLLKIGYSSTSKFLIIKNKYLFSVINNLEYSDILNNNGDISYNKFIGGGLELSSADFLFARLGYYHTLNGNAPDDGLTYGIGINVPLKNIIKKMPIEIKYDYSKFPRYSDIYYKIHSVSVHLNY